MVNIFKPGIFLIQNKDPLTSIKFHGRDIHIREKLKKIMKQFQKILD